MSGWPMIVVGIALAAFALFVMFVAGSDHARIRGYSQDLIAGSLALTVAALVLEYHA